MLTYENFDEAVALDQIQDIQRALGTGVLSGCAPSLPASTSPIQIDVASGTVYVSNTELSTSAGSVTLPDGDSQHPRKDVVYIDSAGAVKAIQGTPRAPKDGTDSPGTDRTVYQPEPPDLSSLSSLADGAVVAEIWVPAGATSTSDMTESGVTYIRDRRLRPWASTLLTSGNIAVSDLGFDTATQSELDNHASTIDAHRSDESIRDVAGAMAGFGLTHDDANDTLELTVVDTGSVTVSAGSSTTVDTGVSGGSAATFDVYLGPTNGTQDSQFAADIQNDSSTGNYVVEIQETDTSAGGTVEYDIIRGR